MRAVQEVLGVFEVVELLFLELSQLEQHKEGLGYHANQVEDAIVNSGV